MLASINPKLLHVLQQVANTSESLLAAGDDLVGRQDETIRSRVTQLDSKDVVGTRDIVDVIHTAAGGLVDGLADGARGELDAVHLLDGRYGTFSQRLQLVVVGRGLRAGEAVSWVTVSFLTLFLILSVLSVGNAYGS